MHRSVIFPLSLPFGLLFGAALTSAVADSNVDPNQSCAWGENIGWTDWRDAGDPAGSQGVIVGRSFLEGYIWGENIGWINVGDGTPGEDCNGYPCYGNTDGSDAGVNVDPVTGVMTGLGWGENIGWVNFEGGALADPPIPAAVDFCNHTLSGFVWSENVGWFNLDDAEHFIALGPCLPGDFDCDGDVDSNDYNICVDTLQGPNTPSDCAAADGDFDGDVDLNDFKAFQSNFTG